MKCSHFSVRYTKMVRNSAYSTATAADSVAVKTPDRMPPRISTTMNRPGSAAANERATIAQPGKLPAG
jgi:hypothetical protein